MFTGFATENTPAIHVWEFSRTFTGIPKITIADDCAPIQLFKTGGCSQIALYLPSCPIEGKRITIYNSRFSNSQSTVIFIYASDVSGQGTTTQIDRIGVGGVLELCYSKNIISDGLATGTSATGWFSLNKSAYSASNAQSINNSNNGSATGKNSVIIGGTSNTASDVSAAVVGGSSNTASQTNAGVFGGSSGSAGGSGAAVVGGQFNISTGTLSGVFCGSSNSANSDRAVVVGGAVGTTRSIIGNFVTPANSFAISGVAGVQQLTTLLLGRETTNATPTVLTSDNVGASTTNQVILPNNSAYTFQGTCIAAKTAAGDTSSWKFEGAIKRGANAASTVLVAAVTPTVIAQDAGASTWVLAITADTTNGGIAVTVTGQAATTIRWVVKIETTEVTF